MTQDTLETETRKRWHVEITYCTASGDLGVEHWIEELEDLDELVERGPSFYAIQKIEIRHNRDPKDTMAVEDEGITSFQP